MIRQRGVAGLRVLPGRCATDRLEAILRGFLQCKRTNSEGVAGYAIGEDLSNRRVLREIGEILRLETKVLGATAALSVWHAAPGILVVSLLGFWQEG